MRPNRRSLGAERALATALALSALAHMSGYAVLQWSVTLPESGFEVQLPASVEIGLVDEPTLPATAESREDARPPNPPTPQPATTPEPPASDPSDAGEPHEPEEANAEPASASADAGIAEQDASTVPLPTATDAGRPSWQPASAKGALISVRIDMDRIRNSPLAPELTALIKALPDVRALLDGSGVDPVADLSRLLVASPDLSRTKAVIAGQHRGNPALARQAAKRLASNRKKSARFARRHGLLTAPWHSPDGTPRLLALLGPQRFAIARPIDLPRVLAIARALRGRSPDASSSDAAALLALPEGAAAQLSVEGVPHFIRRTELPIPQRATLEVTLLNATGESLRLLVTLFFDDESDAGSMAEHLRGLGRSYASHPIAQFTGLSSALTDTRISSADSRVQIRVGLSRLQAQTVLGMVRDAATPPPRARDTLRGPGAPPRAPQRPQRR